MNKKTKTPEQQFWPKVLKSSRCWKWLGAKNNRGYGKLNIKGKQVLAHRLSYEMSYGKIPDGLFILHTCDNAWCVRPTHLNIGNAKQNTGDMLKKNRQGRWMGKSSCKKGHPYDSKNSRGERACSICKKSALKKAYRTRVAARANLREGGSQHQDKT